MNILFFIFLTPFVFFFTAVVIWNTTPEKYNSIRGVIWGLIMTMAFWAFYFFRG
jgi:hypothetical protein